MKWIYLVSSLIVCSWVISAMIRDIAGSVDLDLGSGGRLLRLLFWELRPLFLPAMIACAGAQIARGRFDWVDALTFGCNLFNWWYFKDPKDDDDDDRWKRRKAKLAEKVSVLGSRLVAVPVGAP